MTKTFITEWLYDSKTLFPTGYGYGFKMMTNREWMEREIERFPGSHIEECKQPHGTDKNGKPYSRKKIALVKEEA